MHKYSLKAAFEKDIAIEGILLTNKCFYLTVMVSVSYQLKFNYPLVTFGSHCFTFHDVAMVGVLIILVHNTTLNLKIVN